MRLASFLVATVPMLASPSLAQNAAVLSVTQVSFALPGDTLDGLSNRGFPTDGNRDIGFEIGRPEGSGFDAVPVLRAAPRATVRVADRRMKKAFQMPWQTGVFQ